MRRRIPDRQLRRRCRDPGGRSKAERLDADPVPAADSPARRRLVGPPGQLLVQGRADARELHGLQLMRGRSVKNEAQYQCVRGEICYVADQWTNNEIFHRTANFEAPNNGKTTEERDCRTPAGVVI